MNAEALQKILFNAFTLAILGLVVGYFIFAKHPVSGDLLSPGALFNGGSGVSGLLLKPALEGIRQNVLISGAVGMVVGIILGVQFVRLRGR